MMNRLYISNFIKKIFICVEKINKVLRVWTDMRVTEFSFLCELSLKCTFQVGYFCENNVLNLFS